MCMQHVQLLSCVMACMSILTRDIVRASHALIHKTQAPLGNATLDAGLCHYAGDPLLALDVVQGVVARPQVGASLHRVSPVDAGKASWTTEAWTDSKRQPDGPQWHSTWDRYTRVTTARIPTWHHYSRRPD